MGFYVSMADSARMDIQKSTKYLIRDKLDIKVRHSFFIVLLDIVVQVAIVVGHDNI